MVQVSQCHLPDLFSPLRLLLHRNQRLWSLGKNVSNSFFMVSNTMWQQNTHCHGE